MCSTALLASIVRHAAFATLLLLFSSRAHALPGDENRVYATATPGAVTLVAGGQAAPLWVAPTEHPGVRRAARSLRDDLERVTGVPPALHEIENAAAAPERAVIIGTIGQSALIDHLVREGKLDVGAIEGRWEAFLHETVANPYPGLQHALVIAGSDPRGTIYGVYALSEQIGVSPWYWWADVPVRRSSALHYRAGRWVDAGPVVKYRGIFLNDEAPALAGWVQEKFGGFNHRFYSHLFEVILRLRGNCLWPAMWLPRAFNDDDPQNPVLADEFGIVMGTSHHEPMMRAHDEWNRYGRGPWNYAANADTLREFWRGGLARVKDFEKIVTIGMRGDGDEAMSEETNVTLLETIVADQRTIIGDVMGRDPSQVPQLWALYKEVQGYYERGMRVPDDVILLWCDDNWGNIRRLPTPEERKRAGGAGVYYHFDYVGGPRNYKWINVTPITKVWEQMHLAWRYGADRIWIVNVGDFKPMEFPTEFFLAYAWNPARLPYEKLAEYSQAWAERDFGSEHAAEIAALINGYSKLNRRRTPEMLEPTTLSLVHYREAERVLDEWRDLVTRAERVKIGLPAEFHDAFFQLVLYPVKASANVWELHVAAGLNRWYTLQGRAAANTQARRVATLFQRDAELRNAYHALGGGRWNHQMAQIKMGYTYWQQPNLEAAPAVQQVRPLAGAEMAISIEGSERSWPSYNAGRAQLPPLDPYRRGTRWIEVFNRGAEPFGFSASADQPWVRLQPSGGRVEEQTRIEVSVDWEAAPADAKTAVISVTGHRGGRFQVHLPLERPPAPPAGGFVEIDRHVAIEAPHFTRAIGRGEVEWRVLPDFGRTLGGVTAFPVTAPKQTPGGDAPRLEYDVQLVSSGEVTVELLCAPSLDFQSGEGLQFAVSFDDASPQIVRLNTWETLQTWEKAVGESIRRVATKHRIDRPGVHTLKVWMVTPGVVLERVIIDAGGVRPSYLGPLESPRG
jgi:hypothetical protein